MTAVILDLILVVAFLLSVLIGYFRGFIKSILGAFSLLIALFLAIAFTPNLSNAIYQIFPQTSVSQRVDSFLDRAPVPESTPDNADDDQFLIAIRSILENDGADLAAFLKKKVEERTDALKASISEKITSGICRVISTVIAFIAILVVSYLLLLLLRHLLGLAVKLPGLRQADRILGLVFGLLYGAGLVCIISVILCNIWPVASAWKPEIFTVDAVQNTLFLRWIGQLPLLKALFSV